MTIPAAPPAPRGPVHGDRRGADQPVTWVGGSWTRISRDSPVRELGAPA